jgi:hypothetical protein
MSNNGYILLRVDPFIWNDTSLSIEQKIILNLIFSFTIQGKCCFLSDAWISTKFGFQETLVRDIIKTLERNGWIRVRYAPGVARTLAIIIPGEQDPCDDAETVDVFEV